MKKARKLNNEEMGNLPDTGWSNFTEDESKYKVSFMYAWEVSKPVYEYCNYEGFLCLEQEGKYYVAR